MCFPTRLSTNRCEQSVKYQGTKIRNFIPINLRKQFFRNLNVNTKKCSQIKKALH